MRTWTSVMVVLVGSCLGGSAAAAQVASRTELEQRLLAHINERMYDCCRSVVLTRQVGDVYEGFVVFTNGQRNNLRATVRGGKINYEFLGWPDSEATSKPVQPRSAVELQAELRRLQDTVREQESEIAQLRGFGGGADATAEAEAAPALRRICAYTQAMYRRIEKGMSYAQVAEILGDAGSRISSSYFDGAVNEVWVWINPDDSHACIVFRDGTVLVRSQSGLPTTGEETEEQRPQTRYFDDWLLARQIDGRIVPLDLSFGQWLDQVRETASKTANQPQIDVIEEDNRIVVDVSRDDTDHAGKTSLYLTWLSLQELTAESPEPSARERVCIPTGLRTDGQEDNDPVRAWEVMATMANLSKK